MISINDVSRLYDLYYNGQTNYGTFIYGNIEEGGKVRGEGKLIYAVPTQSIFQRHCDGQQSIGLSPLNSTTGKCTWGAIDIDKYEGHQLSTIARAIYDFHMPLVPFYSKSKKLHLFTFFISPVDASKVREYLRDYIYMFDCDLKTEIFPKQTEFSTTTKGTSNWINLPFFGNERLMLDRNMNTVSIENAIDIIYDKRWSIDDHKSFFSTLPYSDAPPCVQKGAILRDFDSESHCRNNFLFNAAVYLRLKDDNDDIESKLINLNASFDEPIEENRLKATVLSSIKKKSYFYQCDSMPGCDKAKCRQTEFGIESRHSTGLDFGPIEQWLDDPPYYTWMVNGQKMIFYSESDILMQTRFREQAYRFLHIMPRRVKDEHWVKIINRATQDHIVHESPAAMGGFSKGSQFLSHVTSFFNDRRMADDPSQLALGRTYRDENRNVLIFSAYALLKYLRDVKDFRMYSDMEIELKLKDMGARREGSYWAIEAEKVIQEKSDPVEIDFHDKEENDKSKF